MPNNHARRCLTCPQACSGSLSCWASSRPDGRGPLIFRDVVARFVEGKWYLTRNSGVSSTSARRFGAGWRDRTAVHRHPSEYGGAGGVFGTKRCSTKTARRGIAGFGQGVHSICAHCPINHGTEEQKSRFLRPWQAALIGAIGMSEPAANRPAGTENTRGAQWRQLRHQRLEDIHHEWLSRRLIAVVVNHARQAPRVRRSSWWRLRI